MYRNGLEFNRKTSPSFQEALRVMAKFEEPKKVPPHELIIARIIKEL